MEEDDEVETLCCVFDVPCVQPGCPLSRFKQVKKLKLCVVRFVLSMSFVF